MWFRSPLGAIPFGDNVEEVLASDERDAVKEGRASAADVADEILRVAGTPARGRFSGGARDQEDAASEAETLTLHVAIERSLQREAVKAEVERVSAHSKAAVAAADDSMSPAERTDFAQLRGVPDFLKLQ